MRLLFSRPAARLNPDGLNIQPVLIDLLALDIYVVTIRFIQIMPGILINVFIGLGIIFFLTNHSMREWSDTSLICKSRSDLVVVELAD